MKASNLLTVENISKGYLHALPALKSDNLHLLFLTNYQETKSDLLEPRLFFAG